MSLNLTNILQNPSQTNQIQAGPNAGRQVGVVLEDSATVTWATDGFGNIQATSEGGSAPSGAENLVYATPNGAAGAASLRALVAADIPTSLPTAQFGGNVTIGNILGGGAAGLILNSLGNLYLISTGSTLDIGSSYNGADGVVATGTIRLSSFLQVGIGSQLTAAATITPTNQIHHVTGATVIETITVPAGVTVGWQLTLIPDSAGTTGTTGNIALGSTLVQNKALILTWDGTKFYPSY